MNLIMLGILLLVVVIFSSAVILKTLENHNAKNESLNAYEIAVLIIFGVIETFAIFLLIAIIILLMIRFCRI